MPYHRFGQVRHNNFKLPIQQSSLERSDVGVLINDEGRSACRIDPNNENTASVNSRFSSLLRVSLLRANRPTTERALCVLSDSNHSTEVSVVFLTRSQYAPTKEANATINDIALIGSREPIPTPVYLS